ncbi:MAG: DUF3276 family protein [Bacteroidales bacterium]
MEENEKKAEGDNGGRQEIFSQTVRAGKRTYFFDVKATRNNEYYLTITESKKRFNKEGRQYFEKHKVFLYREDFEKFRDGLTEVISFINKEQPVQDEQKKPRGEADSEKDKELSESFTDVSFDDLEK